MNMGKLILLGVALLAIGCLVFLLISGDEQGPVAAIVPIQPKVEMTSVLVADRNYARGEVMDPTGTRWIQWPTKTLPEFFVTDVDTDFFETLGETRARTLIAEGEPIFEAKIMRQGERSMMAAFLNPGMRAVSMQVSAQTATDGFVLPGDRVDIYITLADKIDTSITWNEILYTDVRVMAVDQAIASPGSTLVGNTVTLELTQEQVPSFLSAASEETLSLVLRSAFAGETEVKELPRKASDIQVIRVGRS